MTPETGDGSRVVTQQTLAAWRAALARLRDDERRRAVALSPETGRMLEVVGQVLAQGGGELPADMIAQLEALTGVPAKDPRSV
jgi:hypothetical protein